MKTDDIKNALALVEQLLASDSNLDPCEVFAQVVSTMPDSEREKYLTGARYAVVEMTVQKLAQDLNVLSMPGDPPRLAALISATHDRMQDRRLQHGVTAYGWGPVTFAASGPTAYERGLKDGEMPDILLDLLALVSEDLCAKLERVTPRAKPDSSKRYH
jgi:hypothetical protein